jgi:hypothetical protein
VHIAPGCLFFRGAIASPFTLAIRRTSYIYEA